MPRLLGSGLTYSHGRKMLRDEPIRIEESLQSQEQNWEFRNTTITKIRDFGVEPFYFPQMTSTKPVTEGEPTVPVLMTEKSALKNKRHVIIIINDVARDLGIWTYEKTSLGRPLAVEDTTALGIVQKLAKMGPDSPGLIVTNPGELIWIPGQNRGINELDYYDIFQVPVLGGSNVIRPENHIPGHEDYDDHFRRILEFLLDPENLRSDAKISFVTHGLDAGQAMSNWMQRADPADTDLHRKFFERFGAGAWGSGELVRKPYTTSQTAQIIRDRTKSWLPPLVMTVYSSEKDDHGLPKLPLGKHFQQPRELCTDPKNIPIQAFPLDSYDDQIICHAWDRITDFLITKVSEL